MATMVASCPDDAHKIEQQADSAMVMLIQRLLAGRLYEGWNLLKGFGKHVRGFYEPELSAGSNAALKSLRAYFGKGSNHIAQVRNKIGFHADKLIADAAYANLSDDEDLGSYICKTLGNTIHITPELMHYEAVCEITGERDFVKSMNFLWRETQNSVSNFNMIISNFILIFAKRYLPDALSGLAEIYDHIPALPLSELQFRFFSDLSGHGSNFASDAVATS